jgi:hypothetical protein
MPNSGTPEFGPFTLFSYRQLVDARAKPEHDGGWRVDAANHSPEKRGSMRGAKGPAATSSSLPPWRGARDAGRLAAPSAVLAKEKPTPVVTFTSGKPSLLSPKRELSRRPARDGFLARHAPRKHPRFRALTTASIRMPWMVGPSCTGTRQCGHPGAPYRRDHMPCASFVSGCVTPRPEGHRTSGPLSERV